MAGNQGTSYQTTNMIGLKQLVVVGCISLLLYMQRCEANGIVTDTTDGGGACGTDGDCNENGVCEFNSQNKKVCLCTKDYTGEYCGDKAKNKLDGQRVEPKVQIEITTKDIKEDENPSTGTKRELPKLEYDKESNIIGIEPEILAKTGQEFLIYCPVTKHYLFVSYDKTLTGKSYRAHVEARSDRYGDRNIFTMKKVGNKFRIHNKKTNSDVYISDSKSGALGFRSNDVLAVDSTETKKPSDEKMDFEFEEHEEDGFYRIKGTGDKYLFESHDRAGVPSYRIIEADTKNREKYQTQWFQFVLKYKAKEVKVEYDTQNMKIEETKDIKLERQEFINSKKDAADSKNIFSYERSTTSTAVFRQAKEFSVTGELSAVGTVAEVLKITGKLAMSKKTTTETTDTKQVLEKEVVTREIITKGGEMNCVTALMTRVLKRVPYKITATTKEGNKIEAKGDLEGTSHTDFSLIIKGQEYKDGDRCKWD